MHLIEYSAQGNVYAAQPRPLTTPQQVLRSKCSLHSRYYTYIGYMIGVTECYKLDVRKCKEPCVALMLGEITPSNDLAKHSNFSYSNSILRSA